LPSPLIWPAQRLLPAERQDLAVRVLAGSQPVTELAQQHEVSRKFLYQQAEIADDALARAFNADFRDRLTRLFRTQVSLRTGQFIPVFSTFERLDLGVI
jgi:hypothetical protein